MLPQSLLEDTDARTFLQSSGQFVPLPDASNEKTFLHHITLPDSRDMIVRRAAPCCIPMNRIHFYKAFSKIWRGQAQVDFENLQ